GGQGCISVTCNVAPAECVAIYDAWQAGDIKEAHRLSQRLLPLHAAMFCETNPGPVKYGASLLGVCGPEMRLPMVLPRTENQSQVKKALVDLGVLTLSGKKVA